jgi:hypothetical protein
MGKKPKLRSNPRMARPHKKGAAVSPPLQLLTHKTLGVVSYRWDELWIHELALSKKAHDTLKNLHERILAIEPGQTNMRDIADSELLWSIYEAGSEMVSRSIRSVQYLAETMERISGEVLRESTTEGRIKEATKRLGMESYSETEEYQGLAEIQGIRDALEHPKSLNIDEMNGNIFQGVGTDWDKVPLAWFISDRGLEAYDRFQTWFQMVAHAWVHRLSKIPKKTRIYTVARGIESIMGVKKPR